MVKSKNQEIQNKLKVFKYAETAGNVSKTCRYFGISRETYYEWFRKYKAKGENGLINDKPGPKCSWLRIAKNIEEQILYLRRTYHFGQQRISWVLS
jgi:transposase-like protein